jgi:hypothetical protein
VPDIGYGAGAPVDAASPLHQLLVDQVAAECREVGVAPRDDPVDLGFGVAPAWLEVLDEPAQDGQPLLVLGGKADQAVFRVDEVLSDATSGTLKLPSARMISSTRGRIAASSSGSSRMERQ